MKCKINEKLLALYIEGELPQRKAVKIEAHLKVCARCSKMAEELRWSKQILEENLETPELNPNFWRKFKSETMAKIKAEGDSKAKWIIPFIFRNRFALAIACTLIILISSITIYYQFSLLHPQPIAHNNEQKGPSIKERTVSKSRESQEKRLAEKPTPQRKHPSNGYQEEQQETADIQENSISQVQREQDKGTDMTLVYEDSEITIIWVYTNKFSESL